MLSNCDAREDSWESLGHKEIKPVNPKGNQPWVFIGRTDVEAEAPILWLPNVKSWLIGRDLDAGEDWGQEEKEMTEDEMPGWHPWLNGHEFEQTPGYGKEQGSLTCCSPWGHKVRYDWATEQWHYKSREKSKLSLSFLMRGFFVFVVFWLPWVLVTVLSLSLFVVRGGQLFRGTLASHCSGFSLQSTGSRLCRLQ